jgi:hypothetical protein
MTDAHEPNAIPCEPEIDANGVDLAQIRAMLDLTPRERLSQVFGFMAGLAAIRARNGDSRPR